MLQDTTDKTENVTVILDCCYSGRMARDPVHGKRASPRRLDKVRHHNISRYIAALKANGSIGGSTSLEGNPHAIRIAAAASSETAWEFETSQNTCVGALTGALVYVLENLGSLDASWEATIVRVRDMVNVEFPQQHPRLEGPTNRLLFSMQQRDFAAFIVKSDGDHGLLHAGTLSGVHQGNVYAIMPFGSEKVDESTKIANATVQDSTSTYAKVILTYERPWDSIPDDGALAFLVSDALHKWPVSCPVGVDKLREAVKASRYLCEPENAKETSVLAKFKQEGEKIVLSTGGGIEIASSSTTALVDHYKILQLIHTAEQLARAQYLMSIPREEGQNKLRHDVSIELGTVMGGQPSEVLQQDGTGSIQDGALIYIVLKNNGSEKVYVNVLDINVAGKISLVARSYVEGIELACNDNYRLGDRQFGRLEGLPVTWPNGVPKVQQVDERLVFVISNEPVNLRCLETLSHSRNDTPHERRNFARLIHEIANGRFRDTGAGTQSMVVAYDLYEIPLLLTSHNF